MIKVFNHFKFNQQKYSKSTPLVIALILLFFGLKIGGFYGFYINGDGKGYYAYLPATFIYHDAHFNFTEQTEKKYYPIGAQCDFRVKVNGKLVNKYFAGTAVLWAPFFLAAHFLSHILGFPTDGYSILYQYSVLFAAIFYLWLGIYFLRKLLLSFNFSESSVLILQWLTVFATPLVFYTICNPDWTHLYSFTLICIFLYYTRRFIDNRKISDLIVSMMILGLIILVRPMNGIVILSLPFLAGNWQRLKDTFIHILRHKWILFLSSVLFFTILFLQCVYYYEETGHWIIWSYANEGFHFGNPHLSDVLFSYRRGLFIYTPVTFLALFGFYNLVQKSKFQAIALFSFLFAVIYTISSWHCWWYGMCFGLRPITEFLPFFAILLGFTFQIKAYRFLKYIFGTALAFTVLYNSIQIHQYKFYILHWDNMDKESFWKIFLRTSPTYYGLLWGPVPTMTEPLPANSAIDTLVKCNYLQLNGSKKFSPGLDTTAFSLLNPLQDSTSFYLSAEIKTDSYIRGKHLHWIVSLENKSGPYFYNDYGINMLPLKKGQWYSVSKLYRVPRAKDNSNRLKIYMWNTSNRAIEIKQFHIGKIQNEK